MKRDKSPDKFEDMKKKKLEELKNEILNEDFSKSHEETEAIKELN